MRKFSLQWFKGSYSPAEASTSNQDGKSYSRYEHNTVPESQGSTHNVGEHTRRSYIHGRHHTTLPEDRRSEGGVSDISVQDESHKNLNTTRPEDRLATIEGTGEVTWVIEGHAAPLGSQELSVKSGQQVELLDSVTSGPDWCMVRLHSPGGEGSCSPSREGLVPSSCLKPTPSMRTSANTTGTESEDAPVAAGEAASGNSAYSLPPNNVSPANKRRGPFRKWLSNPVRKLSHGRLDRTSSDSTKPATKKSSAPHHWKLLSGKEEMGNKPASTGAVVKQPEEQGIEKSSPLKPRLTQKSKSLDLNGGASTEEEVCDVELPPPMKIQDHTFTPVPPPPPLSSEGGGDKIATEGTSSADLASEIEQIVKERMEHHIESTTDSSEIAEPKTPDVTSYLPPVLEIRPELRSPSLPNQEEPESPLPVLTETLTTECGDKEKALQKRKYVIEELIDTEEDYVKDLGSIVEGYIAIMKSGEIPVPDDLKNGKDKIVFGNIEAMYEWHRDTFYGELQKCAAEPARLGPLFRRYERRLHMYVVYCQNKPKSEYIVSEFIDTYFEEVRQKLGHKLQLPDLLIKPVQRVMKYQLLLKDILKYTEKAGLQKEAEDLRKAVHIMHVVPKAANDMMNVGRLQGFDGKITAQGKLLLQGSLLVGEPLSGGKMKERQVFLFEQIIIFSESVGQKTQFSNPVYIYKNHLQVNKMSQDEQADDEDNLKFVLKSKDPNQQGLCFVIQGTSQEERDEWVANIRAILDTQLDFLRALQSPIAYQKELTKDISAPELGSLWNPTLRKTLSHPPTSHKISKGSNSEGISTKSLRQPGREKKSRSGEVTPTELRRITVSGASGDVNQDCVSVAPIPISPPSSAIPIEGKQGLVWLESQCKHSFPLEKQSNAPQQSPPKGKRNFFEGFRNTLRPKSKSDLMASSAVASSLCTSQSLDSATASRSCEPRTELDPNKDSGVNRRWSETSSSRADLPSPTLMRAIMDFDGVNEGEISLTKGDTVQLLATDPQQSRYHVQKTTGDCSSPYDGWVPVNVLTQVKEGGRKHWSFKFRKPSFKSDKKEKERRSLDESLILTTHNFPDSPISTPKTEDAPFLSVDTSFHFVECLNNLVVPEGATAALTCRVVPFKQIKINWLLSDGSEIIKIHTDHSQRNQDLFMDAQRSPSPSDQNISFPLEESFSSPEGSSPSPEGSLWPPDGAPLKERVTATCDNDGYCTIIVNRCVLSDSGEYTCLVTSNHHIASTTALLTVLGKPSPPGKPYVVELNGNTVCLQWSPPLYSGNSPLVAYTLEYSQPDSTVWNVAIAYAPNCSQVLEDLSEGQLYLFRVTANNEVGISDPGQQSDPVYIPVSEPKGNSVIPRKHSRVRWKEDFHKNYDELEELGRGRFAVVKRCAHKLSGSQMVAKFVSKKRQDPETVEKELLMLRDLHHHQLVPALDTYYTLQHFVLLLHLVQGPQLFEYICDKTSYDETTVCMFMRQLVEVVRYLHQKVIVHLDIKPENLMVDTQQLSPCLKLIDFGDAHSLDSCNKYIHTLLGNPEFAAPEVISGQPVSYYTDIWSVGVVLYVFLSGVSPFMEEGDEETCSNILRNDFSFPNHYFAHVTREARHLISQLLIKEPHRRLSSEDILQNFWLRQGGHRSPNHVLSTARLSTFVERRRHVQHSIRNIQAPGDAFSHFHSNASSRS